MGEDYFEKKYGQGRFELVSVPDPDEENAFENVVKGAQGFVHVAHDMTGGPPDEAIPASVKMAVNALKAASGAGIKRFVYTSSSFAVTQPKPNVSFTVDESTFNEDALRAVKEKGAKCDGASVYSASKVEAERAMQKWKEENKADIVINCINPNANLGPVLQPEHQGYRTTSGWVKNLLDGKYDQLNRPQEHFINVVDDAKLHVIALAHPDLQGRRLIGMAERAPISKIVGILKKLYPERQFEYFEDEGEDKITNGMKEEVENLLKDAYGHGYTSLEESIRQNAIELK